jgi:hypothetical protein
LKYERKLPCSIRTNKAASKTKAVKQANQQLSDQQQQGGKSNPISSVVSKVGSSSVQK